MRYTVIANARAGTVLEAGADAFATRGQAVNNFMRPLGFADDKAARVIGKANLTDFIFGQGHAAHRIIAIAGP